MCASQEVLEGEPSQSAKLRSGRNAKASPTRRGVTEGDGEVVRRITFRKPVKQNGNVACGTTSQSSKVHLPCFLQIFRPPPAIISQKGAGLIRAVIYLDVLLLVNFLTTALFLLAAGLLCGVSTSGGRVVGGALAGAAASLILLAPALPWPVSVGYQLASGAGIVLLGYGFSGGRCFLRLLAWFAALHFALTGAVLLPGAQANNFSVYLPLSPGLLLVCAGGVYLAVQGILRFLGRNGGQTFPVTLQIGSASLPLRAFCDTGFSVQEPLSGREVVLVRFAAVQNALPGPLRSYLSAYFAAPSTLPPPELGLRFVPCTTVSGHCILPAVPAVLASAPTQPLYAAFCDLPPPPGGWELLLSPAVVPDAAFR